MIQDDNLPTPLTREALYALVWSEPMLKVSARYGVSSSYMARVCKLMNVPRPERGYWAMVSAGKKLPIPPLPDPQPGDQMTWSRGGHDINVARPLPRPPSGSRKRRLKSKTELPSQHQQEIWRREKEERRAAQALKESREELLQIIDRWGRANRIEQFFRDAEQRAAGLSDDERLRLLDRLKLAREMVGSVDALDRFLAWRSPDERR